MTVLSDRVVSNDWVMFLKINSDSLWNLISFSLNCSIGFTLVDSVEPAAAEDFENCKTRLITGEAPLDLIVGSEAEPLEEKSNSSGLRNLPLAGSEYVLPWTIPCVTSFLKGSPLVLEPSHRPFFARNLARKREYNKCKMACSTPPT
ncbi:hypothetical protein WICPIJ_006083 [Wickerhamomyces pijperi]|uniref:Uncharacterized protein n=1 Tax=Wickerhamomyces pijperi TaxID=599730 RepID=A0A9P8TKI9_WICPI|nr:hypothetical protein WICPIJ_006083 [Wickerhamomyces pijperi]